MKKLVFTLFSLFTIMVSVAQPVQRNVVILEIGTGTGCPYCPGASMGAHDLLVSGCQVAVIKYHNYNPSTDPFSNAAAATRCGYYGISGYPTAFFDGTVNYVGGSNTVSMYPQYLPLYNQQYAVPSPVTVNIAGTNIGDTYNITLTINKLSAVTGTDLRAHLVLTESNIPYAWQGQTEVDNAERLMVPGATGTSINFNSGNTVTLNLSFTKDPSWVTANCELVAFVQDHSTKTIYNGAKVMLNALYLPLPTNFTATPTTGCSPMTVNFTDQSTGATQWNWSFPGGTPSSSNSQNPVVVYNTAGTFDVTLNAANPAGNQYGSISKTAFIAVNSAPVAPAIPTGNNALCINPPDQTYTTNPVPNTTGYTWELLPSTAGSVANNGTTCIINWDDAFTGIAQLKVRAANSCGNSPWTPFLNITISTQPGQAAPPAGPSTLCMNPGSTTYTTTGASNAMSYLWDLTPAEAGALYPNGTSVSVAWSAAFTGNATLKVKGVNGSCEGIWSDALTIAIQPGPTAFLVTGGGVYCATGGTGLPVQLNGSETGTMYTLYIDNNPTSAVLPGTGTAISFGNQMTAGSYSVLASTTAGGCTNTMTGSVSITTDPQPPLAPGEPTGPAMIFTGSTPVSEYSTTGGTYATTYTWEISPSEAGTITGNTTTGTATWNLAYTGPAGIKVRGVNACGGGSFSVEFGVTVDLGVSVKEKHGNNTISIFPNPARSVVTIHTGTTLKGTLAVLNTLGNVVREINDVTIQGKYRLSVASLPAGLYFLRITTADGTFTNRLMIE